LKKKLDLPEKLPSSLVVLLRDCIGYRNFAYSSKQAQIWSQEYASVRDSSGNLKEWLGRIIEKDELMKKVFT
jgi:hypothetical protein